MEAHYGKFLDMIQSVQINVPLVDVLAGMPNYGKFLKELVSNKHKLEQISSTFLSDESSAIIQNKVPPKLGDPGSFLVPFTFSKTFSCNALVDLGGSINLMPNHPRRKLFAEFDEFIAMTAEENLESESDTEEQPFKKITFNTDYKIKTSLEESPTDIELKPLPGNLEYVFLEEPSFLPVIISSQIPIDPIDQEKTTFMCPFGAYVYRQMPFGLCNAPATFQMCMVAIFHYMIEESVKVFMDDFYVFGNSFDHCLNNLDKMLQRCKDANLVLN
ncbi:reverse transcriptase domain-containing protein [Tanacetum coccineum]